MPQIAFAGLQKRAEVFEKTLVLSSLDESASVNKRKLLSHQPQLAVVYNLFHKHTEIHFIIPLGFFVPQYVCRKVVQKSQSLEDQKPIFLLRSLTSG